jgi:hypothetical protein
MSNNRFFINKLDKWGAMQLCLLWQSNQYCYEFVTDLIATTAQISHKLVAYVAFGTEN